MSGSRLCHLVQKEEALMKRQRTQLLILVVVLCALAAAFFGIRQYNKVQAQKPAEEEESISVIDAAKDDVTAFS